MGIPTAQHAPFYPLMLTGLCELGGSGEQAQRLLGTAFGAGTIIALGCLGRRVAGDRVGLVAAGLAAVYPMLVTADGALSSESLYGFLVAVTLLAADRCRGATRGVVGAAAGLAATGARRGISAPPPAHPDCSGSGYAEHHLGRLPVVLPAREREGGACCSLD